MESGAKGCEVVVSGKLRAARAKSMKFTDGFMIHSGQPAVDFVDYAVRHVMLRQGVLGIKVKMYVLCTAVSQASFLLTLGLQHEGLGSRRPDRPPKASPRFRPNRRPASGQDRVRAVLRTKGTRQCSRSCPSRGPLPATTARGGLPGRGAVWRVRRSLLIPHACTLPVLHLTYTQFHGVCRPANVLSRSEITVNDSKPTRTPPHGRPLTGRTNCVVGHQSTHVQGIIGLSSVNTLRGPTNELQIGRVAGELVPSRFGMWFVSYSVIHVTILFGIAGAGELGETRILDERPRSQEVLRLGGRLVQAFRRNV